MGEPVQEVMCDIVSSSKLHIGQMKFLYKFGCRNLRVLLIGRRLINSLNQKAHNLFVWNLCT